MSEDVRQPCDHRLAAGPPFAGLGGHQAQRALYPLRLGRAPCLDTDHARQEFNELLGRRIVEADGTAHEIGRLSAPAVAENLVALADLLAGNPEELRRRASPGVRNPMPLAVRY